MSKERKNHDRIRQMVNAEQMKIIADYYAEKYDLPESSAPKVSDVEDTSGDKTTVDALLYTITQQHDVLKSLTETDGDRNLPEIEKQLRIMRTLCNVAIGKIVTGW